MFWGLALPLADVVLNAYKDIRADKALEAEARERSYKFQESVLNELVTQQNKIKQMAMNSGFDINSQMFQSAMQDVSIKAGNAMTQGVDKIYSNKNKQQDLLAQDIIIGGLSSALQDFEKLGFDFKGIFKKDNKKKNTGTTSSFDLGMDYSWLMDSIWSDK